MRRLLVALAGLVLIVAVGAIATVGLGVGPLAARSAARSVVYVAISRSTDEADAREIEAIDLVAGTRELFDAGGRITALVVSADRRSLYVAVDAGRIQFLDAMTGSRFAEVDLRGPTVTSLVVAADGRTMYAVTATNVQSSVVPVDLGARKAGDPIVLGPGAGTAVLRGDSLIVPIADPRGSEVDFVSVRTRVLTDRLTLPRGSLTAPSAIAISATLTGIVWFDPTGGGAGTLRVALVQDPLHWQDVSLAAPFGVAPARGGQPAVFAAAANGIVHVCVPAAGSTRRYIVTPDRKSSIAGTECGPLAGGPDILLGRRDPAQLLVIDPTTGRTARTLPLAGVPARLTR